jgi:Putative lipoprotein GNA1162-like
MTEHTLTQSRVYRLMYTVCTVGFVFFVSGCGSMRAQPHPFFLAEQDRESHGRKTWFDHVVEVDPGGIKVEVAQDYAQNPPRRVAVLPFVDQGSAQFVVNKIPLSFRDEDERAVWGWTYANRLRRALTGYLAQREFIIVNLHTIDTALADRGITDWNALQSVSPQQLGEWLQADTVVYGQVNHYEAYYAFLLASWQISVDVRLVSTADGHPFFSATGSRYSVDLRPAFSLMDIGINSALTLLQLRDVNLARAEDEVGREISLRLPIAERNVATLVATARSTPNEVDGRPVASDSFAEPTLTHVSAMP